MNATQRPVRWGVLSTARIGRLKVMPALQKSDALKIVAIASRDLAAASAVASDFNIPTAYGSYEELLADPTVEAIYNPLPNHLHLPMTLAAAERGKHVLCEKPMALNAAELEALRPHATKVHIREAFMVRAHPQWIETREQVRRGAIGDLRLVHVAFSYFNDDPNNVRNRPEAGGGALYDIGCYAVAAGRWFFEAEARQVSASIDRHPVFATDRTTTGTVDFGPGRCMTFAVSTQAVPYQRIVLSGTRGRLEVEIPFSAPPDRDCRYWIDRGALGDEQRTEHAVPAVDQYRLQAEAFSHAIRREPPSAEGLDDAIANMRVIDALFASARLETSVRL